jgi:prophage tail gpP-like protein/phage tail protein X
MNTSLSRKGGKLSISYRTVQGDTFSLVARKTVGVDTAAADIQKANPGIKEPLQEGVTLIIPASIASGKTFLSSGLDVLVNDIRFSTMPEFSISTRIDAIRKATFTVPNEIATRSVLTPLSPLECRIGYFGSQFAQGRIDTPVPQNTTASKSLTVGMYSEAGLLEANTAPLSSFPREFKNMNLQQIAEDICKTMGVGTIFDFDPGARFKKVKMKQSDKVLSFLSRLAMQRNFIISDDEFGNLVFWRGLGIGAPILEIDDDARTDVQVSVKFNDSQYYSSVTGTLGTKTKRKGKSFTVQNPFFNGIVRPYNFTVKDLDAGELETAVRTTAGRMFASVFTATINIADWKDRNGDIISPNKFIRLRSPSNYIQDWEEFLISGVDLTNRAGSESAQIEVVLPSAYSGEIPERVFWI